jgi:hypothetical protein
MTTTANASPNPGGERRKHFDVLRLVRNCCRSSLRRITSGARSAGCLTLMARRRVGRSASRTRVEAQRKSWPNTRGVTIYQLTNRVRDGRTVYVSADEIVTTVSEWLAEFGATSPLVDDLAQAVRAADWPKTHTLEDHLSVEVTVAAGFGGP